MLKLENVNTGYHKKQVLFDISLAVNQGDIALLIGSNGSGKSTLLKAIFGLNKIWSGNVFFENKNISNVASNELLKHGLMYIPQKNNAFEQLTVQENFDISGLTLNNKKLYNERLTEVLIMLPALKTFLKRTPMKMSGGEKQQLVLAMALIHNPKLLLLDEPFTGLAPKAIEQISSFITQINKEKNTTILMVEHRIKEALPICNQFIGLKLGKIVYFTREIAKFDNETIKNI
jgi:branched-chain amino acid transport system ATP-binding protein